MLKASGSPRPGGRNIAPAGSPLPAGGFLVGIGKTGARIWRHPEEELQGPLAGYVDLGANRSRIKRNTRWREYNDDNGFAYWYWQLLTLVFERCGNALGVKEGFIAPVPDYFSESE